VDDRVHAPIPAQTAGVVAVPTFAVLPDEVSSTASAPTLDQLEASLAMHRQQQEQLSAGLQDVRTELKKRNDQYSDYMSDLSGLPSMGVGLMLLLSLTSAVVIWRHQKHRRSSQINVAHGYFEHSSNHSALDSQAVQYVDALVQRYVSPDSVEHVPMHIENPTVITGDDTLDLNLDRGSVADEWGDMTGVVQPTPVEQPLAIAQSNMAQIDEDPLAAMPPAELVSEEVQKVLKSLAQKRQARAEHLRTQQPIAMLDAVVAPEVMASPSLQPEPEAAIVNIALPEGLDSKWQTHLDLTQEFVSLGLYDQAIAMYHEAIANAPQTVVQYARVSLSEAQRACVISA
jgi:hypothetical protein